MATKQKVSQKALYYYGTTTSHEGDSPPLRQNL